MSRTTDVQLMIDFVYEECVGNESNDSKMQNEMEITACSSREQALIQKSGVKLGFFAFCGVQREVKTKPTFGAEKNIRKLEEIFS